MSEKPTPEQCSRHPLVDSDDNPHLRHIHMAWEYGMACLRPSREQLEHGLEVHTRALALDTFGFPPTVWTQRVVDALNQLSVDNVGAREWHFRSGSLRKSLVADDPDSGAARTYIKALRASGLNGMVKTAGRNVVPGMNDLEREMINIASNHYVQQRYYKDIFQAHSVEQLRHGIKQGLFAWIWSMNSPPTPGRMIDAEDEFSWIEAFYHLGYRLAHLSYNRRTTAADGGVEDGGLSKFGVEMIGRFNEIGLIVDTPHTNTASTLQAAKVSSKPIMASHVGCRALYDHHRNKTDEELRAIADSGGLIGIVGLAGFLGRDQSINALLDHVDHAVKVAGAAHVAIGTDSGSSVPVWPKDCQKPAQGKFDYRWAGGWGPPTKPAPLEKSVTLAWTNWPLFTVGLVQRGYRDEDIEKILGNNLMRVLADNEPSRVDGGEPIAGPSPLEKPASW